MDHQITQESSLPPPPPMVPNVNCDVDKSKQIQMPMMIAPGNHERAWNDPPMFGVSVNVTSGAKPSGVTKLNKRVAFPLSASASTQPTPILGQPNASLPPGLPSQIPVMPPTQFVPTTIVNFVPPSSTILSPKTSEIHESDVTDKTGNKSVEMQNFTETPDNSEINSSTNVTKETVLNILRKTVGDSSLELSQQDEILKRLVVVDSDWDNFNQDLKLKLQQLASCLQEQNYKEADKIQMLIGQDYMSQHSSWILALRNVIRMLIIVQEQ